MRPTVSVCLATHDDGPWLDEALESVRRQTFGDLEIVVVDDASTDGTTEVLRRHASGRMIAVRNNRNLGEARTMNRAFALARGEYVKLLHGDDRLAPDCLERMLPLAQRDGVGLVLSRRNILTPPGDAGAAEWARRYARIHERLGRLQDINHGRELFRRYLDVGLLTNCLSEPSGVLIRRQALERVGGLHLDMVGHLDVDLFMRVAYFYDVGFVDAPLFTYRRHGGSASSRRVARQLHFLDHAWSLEGLRRYPELWAAEPRLAELHVRELRRVVKRAVGAVRLGPWRWKLARLAHFAAAGASARAGLARPVHGVVPAVRRPIASPHAEEGRDAAPPPQWRPYHGG
jgi:glycosyltransferase involved in cell wall biosynthesis